MALHRSQASCAGGSEASSTRRTGVPVESRRLTTCLLYTSTGAMLRPLNARLRAGLTGYATCKGSLISIGRGEHPPDGLRRQIHHQPPSCGSLAWSKSTFFPFQFSLETKTTELKYMVSLKGSSCSISPPKCVHYLQKDL